MRANGSGHAPEKGMLMRDRIARLAVACLLGGGASMIAGTVAHADPDALWKIVHQRCVPDQQMNNDPKPCVAVDLADGEARGHVILKDRDGATQFLLIPTARVAGIESREIIAPDAPNYFAAAWAAREEVDAVVRRILPREDIGLAINSIYGRSQDQLHIHIDCLRGDVIDALHVHAGEITEAWSAFPVPLAGNSYLARRLDGAVLDQVNPFRLLADGVPAASADMGHETLVVAGATFPDGKPGFVLLADHADLAAGDRASGEELQDHDCAVAR
jgi:CDP-diacylglycerol pyrophosphatase